MKKWLEKLRDGLITTMAYIWVILLTTTAFIVPITATIACLKLLFRWFGG